MSNATMTSAGSALAHELKHRGKTAKWLADEAGVSPQYLNDLMHGRRGVSAGTALVICQSLRATGTSCTVLFEVWNEWAEPDREQARRWNDVYREVYE